MIVHIDCECFYVSCERVFNPKLRNKPVVVLSNNDGCAVSISPEAKALGIIMGDPIFQKEKFCKENGIELCSSNYTLYGVLSNRVYKVLAENVWYLERYSIDDYYGEVRHVKNENLYEYAKAIKERLWKWLQMPVRIGLSLTKTLANLATQDTKMNKQYGGIRVMIDEDDIQETEKHIPIKKIWGIGGAYTKFLNLNGIYTAYDFRNAPDHFIKKNLTVVGMRTLNELRGKRNIPLLTKPRIKKGICTARSFGAMLSDPDKITAAIATYAVWCAEKLRKQHSCTNKITVFLETNPFREDQPQHYGHTELRFPVPTQSSMEIERYAHLGFDILFRNNYKYKKAGVFLSGFVPETEVQLDLFDKVNREKEQTISDVLDYVNGKYGRDFLRLGAQGTTFDHKMRQERLSQNYMTSWDELLTVNI